MSNSRNNRNSGDDAAIGCVVYAILAIVAMPLVGIYMISKGDDTQKSIGIALTIVGIILWIYLFSR